MLNRFPMMHRKMLMFKRLCDTYLEKSLDCHSLLPGYMCTMDSVLPGLVLSPVKVWVQGFCLGKLVHIS